MTDLHFSDLKRVIKSHTGYECYLDVIPDSATLPAITISNIGESPVVSRVLSGKKTGNASENLIGLVTSSMSDLDNLVKQFNLLDNTSNEYFQQIYIDFRSRDPYDGETNVFRVMFNLTAIR